MLDSATAYLPIRPLWRHRDLLLQFTRRYIDTRHKGSILGFFWAVLNPLLMLALYTFVFGVVLKGHFGNRPMNSWGYALTVFLGLMLFHLVADILGSAPPLIVANANFVKKVVFPLEILPAAAVGAALFHFCISLGLFLLGALVLGQPLGWTACWLPVIALPLVWFALGLGWLLAALGVFFRDLQQVITPLTMVIMYTSCVFWAPETLPASVMAVLRFNPLLHTIDLARQAVLWDQSPAVGPLAFTYLAGALMFCLGSYVFYRTRPAFADVV